MMEHHCAPASIVLTNDAFTTAIFEGHITKFLASLRDGLLHILCTVSIGSCLWHIHLSIPVTHVPQSTALPLSYRGMVGALLGEGIPILGRNPPFGNQMHWYTRVISGKRLIHAYSLYASRMSVLCKSLYGFGRAWYRL